MADKYEFRIYKRTQRVHIFEHNHGASANMSLCGEVKLDATLPGHSAGLDKAKKFAQEYTYTCHSCGQIIAKLVPVA